MFHDKEKGASRSLCIASYATSASAIVITMAAQLHTLDDVAVNRRRISTVATAKGAPAA